MRPETGVPLAAAGRNFSDLAALGETVTAGSPIDGFIPDRIEVKTIAIRDDAGIPRDPDAMDREAAVMVEQELRRGRDVLLHVLDASKTGLMALTRQTARSLSGAAQGRVRVVIDACQLRSPLAQLQRDLANGFMVTVTGSKFAGGPPFAGALLLPAAVAEEIAARGSFAAGIVGLFSRSRLAGRSSPKSEANIGLGLRWVAALDAIASLASVGGSQQALIKDHFARRIRARATEGNGFALHPDDADESLASRSITPLTVLSHATEPSRR